MKPMAHFAMTAATITAAAVTSACGSGNEGGSRDGTTGADAEPGPGAYQTDYEASEAFFTRMSEPANSGSVHGSVRIWYSANVMDLPPMGPFVAPEGTVAIKNEYDASNDVFVKVVMIKKPAGYDPSNNDWYYEARNADDTLANDPVPGKPSLCIDCHRAAEDTDYLQGFSLSN
jgi:hypothetical protein